MSDHTYDYVSCNGCDREERKQKLGPFARTPYPPDGWVAVEDNKGRKQWDLCPDCNAAFVRWLMERNGALPKKETA